MSADPKGNDITEVDIPIDGQLWVGPNTVPLMEKTELMSPTITIPEELSPLGLLTADGGPEWTIDGVGDVIEFFQEGYTVPGVGGSYLLSATAAQNQPFVDELLTGDTFDADGYRVVKNTSNQRIYTVLSQVIYKSGRIVRRMSNNVTVSAGAKAKAERSAVQGTSLTFKHSMMPGIGYFAEAKFNASDVPPANSEA